MPVYHKRTGATLYKPMRFRRLLFLLIPGLAFCAAPVLQFAVSFQGAAQRAVPLAGGAVLILGSRSDYYPPGAVTSANKRVATSLTTVSASGDSTDLPASGLFGHGNDVPEDAAIDRQGNIWVVGTTDSDDFPLVSPLISQKAPYGAMGFVVKLDPTGSKMLFSSFLGGRESNPSPNAPSRATNIALDPAGNAYIMGITTQADFPQTSAVLGTGKPRRDSFGGSTYTFVAKISGDGAHLLYSTLIGADKFDCVGGSHCLGKGVQTIGHAIAVNAGGVVTIAGGTNATNFPVTARAFQKSCQCRDTNFDGFVARISANGTSLIWATYLGSAQDNPIGRIGGSVAAIAVDQLGDVYATGSLDGVFPTTPGVIQPTAPAPDFSSYPDRFAAKLSADGSSLIYGTYLGGVRGALTGGLTLDAAGNIWIAGTTTSSGFPTLPNVAPLGNDFVLELDATATALTQLYRLPTGTVTQPPAFDSNGNLLLLASRGTLLRLSPVNGLSDPGVLAIANAASLELLAGVSPGELVTIFGVGLGPADGIAATPGADGLFPTELGGLRVLFGSKAAPLFYAGPNQINVQVPFDFGYPLTVEVLTPVSIAAMQIGRVSSLGIFHQANSIFAAALNQDGSVNSASNPAAPGSVISLFATGLPSHFGQVDGALSPGPDPIPPGLLNLRAISGFSFLPILYAGAAPGLIDGVNQINIQLPPSQKDPQITLSAAALTTDFSNTVQVYAH
ncbi:MAG: hypothetical protein M3Z23_08655 [Acidobacteriota bacterium]|nr:hypothetical protein [Acidobacteriota bacterium]